MYPSSGTVLESTIEADTHELLCHYTRDISHLNNPRDTLHFILTRGAGERDNPEQNRMEVQRSTHHSNTLEIIGDHHDAVAYHLSILSARTTLTEDDAYGFLINAGIDMVDYEEWRSSFSRRDRAERLFNDAQERIRNLDSHIDYAILNGGRPDIAFDPSWRSTALNPDVAQAAEEWRESIDSNSCYARALMALDDDVFDAWDDVQYCEGLALPSHPSRASTHAWLEVDSDVVELLWSWDGPDPPNTTLYYGDSIPLDKVRDIASNRPTDASVLLTEEQYYSLQDVKQALAAQSDFTHE